MHSEQSTSIVREAAISRWTNSEEFVGKPLPHEAIKDFTNKVIVAGTRDYDDYAFFSKVMLKRIKLFEGSIIFISGKAKTGADALIIQFCEEHKYPWTEFPANWDIGKQAGYIRNVEMANVASDLILFFDGKSRGSKHMSDIATEKRLHVVIVMIDIITKIPTTTKGV